MFYLDLIHPLPVDPVTQYVGSVCICMGGGMVFKCDYVCTRVNSLCGVSVCVCVCVCGVSVCVV